MAKDNIGELVFSLTKGEKREFVALSNRHNRKPEYLNLYRLYLKSSSISEKEIAKKLKIDRGRVIQLRYELKKALFEYLPTIHHTIKKQLVFSTFVIEELIARNHLELASIEIRRSKKKAIQIEAIEILGELLDKEALFPSNFYCDDEIKEQRQKLVAIQNEIRTYDRLLELVRSSVQEKSRKQLLSRLKVILSDVRFSAEPTSLRAKEKFWLAKITGAQIQEKWGKTILFINAYLELIENNFSVFENAFELRLKQLKFLPILFSLTWNQKSWRKAIFRIRQTIPKNKLQSAAIFSAHFIPEIIQALASGNFQTILQNLKECESDFETYFPLIGQNERVQLLFLLSNFYFFQGKIPKALKYCRAFFKYDSQSPVELEYLPYFRTLAVLAYSIQDDHESFLHHSTALSYFLSSRGIDFQYFRAIPKLGKILLLQDSITIPISEMPLIQTLSDLREIPQESLPFKFFDIVPWLLSITTGQPIEKILAKEYESGREKYFSKETNVS